MAFQVKQRTGVQKRNKIYSFAFIWQQQLSGDEGMAIMGMIDKLETGAGPSECNTFQDPILVMTYKCGVKQILNHLNYLLYDA